MATSAKFKKDSLSDRESQIASMKGFKGSKWPSKGFKDAKPRTEIDPFYTPHKGGEKQ